MESGPLYKPTTGWLNSIRVIHGEPFSWITFKFVRQRTNNDLEKWRSGLRKHVERQLNVKSDKKKCIFSFTVRPLSVKGGRITYQMASEPQKKTDRFLKTSSRQNKSKVYSALNHSRVTIRCTLWGLFISEHSEQQWSHDAFEVARGERYDWTKKKKASDSCKVTAILF